MNRLGIIILVTISAAIVILAFGFIFVNNVAWKTLFDKTKKEYEKMTASSSMTILVGGDVMFDRNVRKIATRNGYDSLLREVSPIFKDADITVVNLEGPITSNDSRTLLGDGSTTDDLVFTFDPKTAPALKEAGIKLVNLANNHTDNFGRASFDETKSWLDGSLVEYFGNPWNSEPTEKIETKGNIHVAFVGYNSFRGGLDSVTEEIKRLSDGGNFVIVMPHWGEEYVTQPTQEMRKVADIFIKAGAKAIIGSHPHVIIDHEFINGVPVIWSLGNLLFDQYFSPEVTRGELVRLTLTEVGDQVLIDKMAIYEVSTASREKVTVSAGPNLIYIRGQQ